MMKQILFVMLFSVPLFGQLTGNAQLVLFPGAPSGSCTSRQLGLNQSNGSLYVCINSAWQLSMGGGGGTALQGCATATPGALVCDASVQGGTGTVGMLTMPYASGGLPTPPTGHQAAIAPDAGGNLFWSPGSGTQFVAIGTGGGGQGPAGVASFNGRTGAVLPQASDYSAFFAPIGTGGGGAGTATALQFGSTTFVHSTTAPTPGECLMVTSDTIIGVNCGPLGGVNVID